MDDWKVQLNLWWLNILDFRIGDSPCCLKVRYIYLLSIIYAYRICLQRKNNVFFLPLIIMQSQSHSTNYSLCKVQECVGTPFTERCSIIEQAKIKDVHTTITHIDNKTITVWLFHKQTNKKKNVGFPNIFACGKPCFSSIESVTFFAISGTSSHMVLCCGFPQHSDKSFSIVHFKVCMVLNMWVSFFINVLG